MAKKRANKNMRNEIAHGSMAALLKDALKPNLIQTLY